jgi:predicted RNA-binding protein with PIN domain
VSTSDGPEHAVPPPSAETLETLPSDVWAVLLPSVRAGLLALDERDNSPTIRRLRAAPTGRLAGGRVRRELCELLARGGAPWLAVLAELRARAGLPPLLAALVRGESADVPATPAPAPGPSSEPALDRARSATARAKERLRQVRDERDDARRRAERAEQRASAAEAELVSLGDELAGLRAERDRLAVDLAAAEDQRRRAVEREARRRDVEIGRLHDELASLRREVESQRLAERRRAESRRQVERDVARAEADTRREDDARRTRVRPGRPSVLPPGVAPGTAEAVEVLLHAGRLVLVDGYNVTKQHRGHLPLETQRTWLIHLLATLAAQRRVRPVVYFDGEQAAGSRPLAGSREVGVRFTPAGITADDELVLAVEATDEPVVVVTDDRELQARLRRSGADVVGTAPFLWAVR